MRRLGVLPIACRLGGVTTKRLYLVSLLGVWVLVAGTAAPAAPKPPTEACTLLPVAQVGKAFGTPFHVTTRNGEIAPLGRNTAPGSQCSYTSKKRLPGFREPGGNLGIWYVVYVESSTAVARNVFTSWRSFIDRTTGRTTTVAGIGDAAFRDPNYVLHVRTGKAHFDMGFNPGGYKPPNDQQERQRDLAQWVVRHL